MSSLWTPEGEHPVDRDPETAIAAGDEEEPSEAELAALHLSLRPPQLDEAALAIDALGAMVERLEGRLGDEEATLRDGLAQLRLAFVSVKSAATAAKTPGDDEP